MRGGLGSRRPPPRGLLANIPDIVPPHLAVLGRCLEPTERMADFHRLLVHSALAGVPW